MPETMTADIVLLCAAIDAGDDSALPILADALEEMGDEMAAGLRHSYRPLADWTAGRRDAYVWLAPVEWQWDGGARTASPPSRVYRRLEKRTSDYEIMDAKNIYRVRGKGYPTRSAAYLALARALTVIGDSSPA